MASVTSIGKLGSAYYADSTISDLRIYNKALTASEVADLYYQGLATHSSGTESDDRYPSGTKTYTSPVIDLSANGQWGTTPISFTQYLNGGTISYYTRTSADNSTWSSWQAVSGNTIASNPRRYFQWKADLTANSGLNDSPVIGGMTVSYVQDSTAPTNPTATALGFVNSASASASLTSGSWYNYATPKFTWQAGTDTAASGQSASGVASYHVLLTTDNTATPSANLSDDCYLSAAAGSESFVVGTTPSTCSLSNGTYYLRLQTKDNSGNTADPVTLFTYKYDATAPDAPASVASNDIGYKAENSFSFFWPAASDNGPSGVASYEYKTGATSGAYSAWQSTTATSVAGVPAYTEGQNVFYVRAKDAAGNVSTTTSSTGTTSFYYNATAPTAPTSLSISPTTSSGSPASSNSFTVTWGAPTSVSGSVAKYYYCVNCTPSSSTMTETTSAQTAARTLSSVALATQQGKNTFYIVAEDNNVNSTTGHGNRNFDAYASADFYASTTAPGAPTNLTISDASDRDNSKWRITLAWTAPTTGSTVDHYQIYRSTDNSSFSAIGTASGTAYTDAGLTQSQNYYYKVYSVDNAGAKSLASGTVNKAPEGKYSSPPPAGGTPSASAGSATATITWSTTRKAFGTVEYGKTSSYGSSATESTATKSHSIKISGLAPGTTYHYRTMNMDDSSLVGYDRTDAYSADYTFTTLASPAISGVTVDEVGLDWAVISWTTASLVSSKIDYGPTTEYGQTVEVATTTGEANHSAKLTGLTHSTSYHFKISGVDADSNDVVSDDYTFKTITFPKVTAYVLKTDQTAGGTTVALAWKTNVPTTSVVEYQAAEISSAGRSLDELSRLNQSELAKIAVTLRGDPLQQANPKLAATHVMRLGSLKDGTMYIFTLRGRDEHGNEAVSDPIRYITGKDTRPPVLKNINVETQITGSGLNATAQILVSWDTDEPADAQIFYGRGSGTDYPFSTPKSGGFTKRHMVVLRDLSPTSAYHLKIVSQDKTGNEARSGSLIAVTPASQESALDVVLNNLEDVFGFLKL